MSNIESCMHECVHQILCSFISIATSLVHGSGWSDQDSFQMMSTWKEREKSILEEKEEKIMTGYNFDLIILFQNKLNSKKFIIFTQYNQSEGKTESKLFLFHKRITVNMTEPYDTWTKPSPELDFAARMSLVSRDSRYSY